MITFIPLSSGSDETASTGHAEEPLCYLLQVDEVRILLDLGGYDPRKPSTSAIRPLAYEEKIRELSPSISLVLLSHSQSTYLGLYPYARAHWGLKCPVYATQPTVEMGRMVCLEEVMSWRQEVPLEEAREVSAQTGEMADGNEGGARIAKSKQPLLGPFICTAEEVNEAFNWIKAIRYNQPVHMPGILSHLLLTPYSSGHTLGGTVFKIRSPTSGSIVYALGLNHTTERHLDATVLLPGGAGKGLVEGLQRPDVLIAEGGRSLVVGAKQKDKAKAILDLVTQTLQSGKSLLLPVDASPRLLEVLILLDQHWSYEMSRGNSSVSAWQHPLCLVTRTAPEMLALARSLIEWMGTNVEKEQNNQKRSRRGARDNGREWIPLALSHVQLFPTADALMRAYPRDRPKLVMAVPISLNYGSSRLLFKTMAADKGNVILLTGRSEASSLTYDLFERWNIGQVVVDARYGGGQVGKPVQLNGTCHVTIDEKVPLSGDELENHLEAERISEEKEAANKAAVERSRRMLEANDLESDSDSDASSADGHLDDEGATPNGDPAGLGLLKPKAGDAFAETDDIRATSFDIYVKGQQTRAAGFFRSTGGNITAQQRFRMFPFVERKGRRVDTYGENLDLGAWIRKGREIELEVEPEEVKEVKRRKKEEDEKRQLPQEPPSKYVHEAFDVDLAALIAYVDMEGQHDGRAIKTIIPMLNPRRLIVVKSSAAAKIELQQSITASASAGFADEVFYPAVDQEIAIGEQTQQWGMNLSEGMMAWVNGSGGQGSAKWSKYEDQEIAMIIGRVIRAADASGMTTLDLPRQRDAIESQGSGQPGAGQSALLAGSAVEIGVDLDQGMLAEEAQGQDDDVDMDRGPDIKPFYDNLLSDPAQEQHAARSILQSAPLPRSLFMGDLRLTTLKASLVASGIPAEFVGEGTLLCGTGLERFLSGESLESDGSADLVVVRKGADGSIELESGVGDYLDESAGRIDTFSKVQAAVYGAFGHVIVC